MTISFDILVSTDDIRHETVDDVIKVCVGKNGVHYWKKSPYSDKVLNYFIHYHTYDNIRIFD